MRGVAFAACLALAGVARADSTDELRHRISESLALCAAADGLPPSERAAVLTRGLDAAEAAVALDARSADAHFAVVCNLGKATGLARVGFGTFAAVSRLREEIDVTLALAPSHAEALAAKGALLLKLPSWLGGNRGEGRRWLRAALAVDPSNATARLYLEEAGAPLPVAAPAVAR